eukprot:14524577-Ditylum_brightwellii.AAC.1
MVDMRLNRVFVEISSRMSWAIFVPWVISNRRSLLSMKRTWISPLQSASMTPAPISIACFDDWLLWGQGVYISLLVAVLLSQWG